MRRPFPVLALVLAIAALLPARAAAQPSPAPVVGVWRICLWPGWFEQQGCGELTVVADTQTTPYGGPKYLRARHTVDLDRLVNILIRREPCATWLPLPGDRVLIQLSPRGCGRSADDHSLVGYGELRGDTVTGSWEVTCNPDCGISGSFRMIRVRDPASTTSQMEKEDQRIRASENSRGWVWRANAFQPSDALIL
jgi:hypothetical protein